MAGYLTLDRLTALYPKAGNMDGDDVAVYLARANAFAYGEVAGTPVYTDDLPKENLEAAVALAFEIFAKGETAQIDPLNGNITDEAPAGFYARRASDPLDTVKAMLKPFATAVDRTNTQQSERGMAFL